MDITYHANHCCTPQVTQLGTTIDEQFILATYVTLHCTVKGRDQVLINFSMYRDQSVVASSATGPYSSDGKPKSMANVFIVLVWIYRGHV